MNAPKINSITLEFPIVTGITKYNFSNIDLVYKKKIVDIEFIDPTNIGTAPSGATLATLAQVKAFYVTLQRMNQQIKLQNFPVTRALVTADHPRPVPLDNEELDMTKSFISTSTANAAAANGTTVMAVIRYIEEIC